MNGNGVRHIFVLMLENRSFDHMLGFSNLTGMDAATGAMTSTNGLNGAESNTYNGLTYQVAVPADFAQPVDPGHEFPDILLQLCGPGAAYPKGGPYPPIKNTGYVASYVANGGIADPGQIMRVYEPSQLPVLNALAAEFAVSDNWYSSMPGPTWPNRLFLHAASSAGLDHSPSTAEIIGWETISGLSIPNGTIFDALKRKQVSHRLYAGDDFPMVAALKGIALDDIRPYHHFASDLAQPTYPYSYIFIEPSYNALGDYRCSTSQHPLDDVTRGEALIKSVYETIRNSAFWEDSLLILTWDEPGGFYDHAIPPRATPPGDTGLDDNSNQYGFAFDQYGPRVPAVIVSPRIPKNLVDHRVYDHTSVLATVEKLFGLGALTARDAAARDLLPLVTLETPRPDAPLTLPDPAVSGVGGCPPVSLFDPLASTVASAASLAGKAGVARPEAQLTPGNLVGTLHAALRRELASVSPELRENVLAQVGAIQTRGQAADFLEQVRARLQAAQKA
jgi:phospholipase C